MDAVFGILGRTALRIDGRVHEGWGPPRERAVLAALLVHAGRPVPIDTLIEWVWPEESAPPHNPVSTFHTYAARLRKSLLRASESVALIGEAGSYRLEVGRSEIDYYRFRELMNEARVRRREGAADRALTLARQAIALWRGRPLDELRTDRARNWRRRVLVDEWLPANVTLLEAMLEMGENEAVLARVDDLLAEHADDLALAKIRLAALHGLARYGDVSAYYFNVRRRLLKESDTQAVEHLGQFHVTLVQPPPAGAEQGLTRQIGAPRQLPHDIPDFVGRTDQLRALDMVTARAVSEPSGGLVILDGMAGVGKTALAVHWGHLARNRFPDGDFFIDLNGFSDDAVVTPARVVDEFLIALGHSPDKSLDQRSRELFLRGQLANRRALVVLDNARDTAHVKDLITLLPSCLVIVTSRQRLTTLSVTTGARRVRVEPMPAAEAAELLTKRLDIDGPIDLDDRDRLVRLCGGLPLVITVLADHLAASGTARFSAFARQLDRRQLITQIGDDGDGSAIAHTFFSHSYQRLAGEEQRLFRLLSLHPGPAIGVDVACACDGRTAAQTKRSFGVLVGAHLIERPDTLDRYRFHDLIREFARYSAERDEPAESRRAAELRMLTFYLRSAAHADRALYPYRIVPGELPAEPGADPLTFDSTAEAKFWFDQERTNLTAVIRFAHGHGYPDHAWRLADSLAMWLDRHGHYDDSRAVRELAVSGARAAGNRDGEMSSIEGLGMVYLVLGELTKAQQCLDDALGYALDAGNEHAQAAALHHLGRLAMLRGDPVAAVDLYRQCLEVAQRIDDRVGQCWTHCRIGEALRILDQHDQAIVHLHQALWFAQRIDDQSAHASAMATIGSVFRDRGDLPAATAYGEQALRIAEAIPDLEIIVQVCTTLAEIILERGDAKAAVRYAEQAVEVCRRTHAAAGEARSREVLGDVHFATGDIAEAVEAWRSAADLYDYTGNPTRAAVVAAKLSQIPAGEVQLPTPRQDSPEQSTSGSANPPEGDAKSM